MFIPNWWLEFYMDMLWRWTTTYKPKLSPGLRRNQGWGFWADKVVMDKFNTLPSPNCWLWLSSTRQSELFHSSSQYSSNSSTHKRIIEFCNLWFGSKYIRVRDWLFCFHVAHCKITTQLSQMMLGIIDHYKNYVQCPKSGLGNMAHLLQHTKGSWRNFALPTMWNMNFGFALTTSTVVWVGATENKCWIGL